MRMSEVMTEGVGRPVKPTTGAADAWELMRRKRIHHLVVMQGAQ
jgi:signal-transduction protein with cAMP-binding, CBS, and nucleotidyltransferase domain